MRKYFELERELEPYEHSDDSTVLPGMLIVARLDGKNFHSLDLQSPYDERFMDLMAKTAIYLESIDFQILCAYVQSDEISLLFHPKDRTFNRKIRKINSILSGSASAYFTDAMLNSQLRHDYRRCYVFDCRTLQFPSVEKVVQYFSFRQEDAARNCINMLSYDLLKNKKGMSPNEAHAMLMPMNRAARINLLYENGIFLRDVPLKMRNGVLIENNVNFIRSTRYGKKFRRLIREILFDADPEL